MTVEAVLAPADFGFLRVGSSSKVWTGIVPRSIMEREGEEEADLIRPQLRSAKVWRSMKQKTAARAASSQTR